MKHSDEEVIDDNFSDDESEEPTKLVYDLGKFNLYRSSSEIQRQLSSRKPVSIIINKQQLPTVYACFKMGIQKNLVPLKLKGDPQLHWCLHYYELEIIEMDEDDEDEAEDMTLEEIDLDCYGVLLPMLTDPRLPEVDGTTRWCLVTDQWTTLVGRYSLDMPVSYMGDAIGMLTSDE